MWSGAVGAKILEPSSLATKFGECGEEKGMMMKTALTMMMVVVVMIAIPVIYTVPKFCQALCFFCSCSLILQ